MRFPAKKILLIFLCFLTVMSLSSCQEQSKESSPSQIPESSSHNASGSTSGHVTESTSSHISESTSENARESSAVPTPENSPVRTPAYAIAMISTNYGYFNRTVYLDKEGAMITNLPGGADFLWDCFSGEALYYQVRKQEEVLLYNLEGRYLESSPAGYGYNSVGPYVLRGTEKSIFGSGITRGNLVDPETGECLLKDVSRCIALGNGKALLLNGEYEAAYLMDRQGKIETWSGEEPGFYAYYSDSLLYLRTSGLDYLVYDEDAHLLKKIEAAGKEIYMQTDTGLAGLEPLIIAKKDRKLEIWDVRRDAYYALGEGTDLFRNEKEIYVQSTGRLLWNGGRLYDMKGRLIREFREIYATNNPAMPLVAWQGSTVYVLDESGGILREKEIPDLEGLAPLGTAVKVDGISCLVRSRGGPGNDYRSCHLLLNSSLEPISDRLFNHAEAVTSGVLLLYYYEESHDRFAYMLMDDTGRILMQNIRNTGWAVDGHDSDYIAVAQGPYIGLIDREGNWIRKNRIYDLPPAQYIDD